MSETDLLCYLVRCECAMVPAAFRRAEVAGGTRCERCHQPFHFDLVDPQPPERALLSLRAIAEHKIAASLFKSGLFTLESLPLPPYAEAQPEPSRPTRPHDARLEWKQTRRELGLCAKLTCGNRAVQSRPYCPDHEVPRRRRPGR